MKDTNAKIMIADEHPDAEVILLAEINRWTEC